MERKIQFTVTPFNSGIKIKVKDKPTAPLQQSTKPTMPWNKEETEETLERDDLLCRIEFPANPIPTHSQEGTIFGTIQLEAGPQK